MKKSIIRRLANAAAVGAAKELDEIRKDAVLNMHCVKMKQKYEVAFLEKDYRKLPRACHYGEFFAIEMAACSVNPGYNGVGCVELVKQKAYTDNVEKFRQCEFFELDGKLFIFVCDEDNKALCNIQGVCTYADIVRSDANLYGKLHVVEASRVDPSDKPNSMDTLLRSLVKDWKETA